MKKFTIAILAGLICGAAVAASLETASAAAGATTASFVNTQKKTVELKSAYLTFGAGVNDTFTLSVSKGGAAYAVDSVAVANTATTARVDFDIKAYVGYGETCTVTRTTASTGTTMKVLFAVE